MIRTSIETSLVMTILRMSRRLSSNKNASETYQTKALSHSKRKRRRARSAAAIIELYLFT